MRTVAMKQPTRESAKPKKREARSRFISPLSPGMPLLQRQCACGGGCPRCQDDLGIQTKLKIGEPGDKYEQEADRIADEVMRMPEPSVQRQVEFEEEEEEMVQRKAIAKPTPLHSDRSSSEVPPIIHEALHSPGQPLDPKTRTLMESHFVDDFSQVRVHTDAKAAQSARSLNALAYTVGKNIFFGTHQYAPNSTTGQYLLAHELTHTLQQQGTSGFTAGSPSIQRLCGSAAIGSVGGCLGLNSDITDLGSSSDLLYLFQVNCDEFLPGEEARLTDFATQITSDQFVDVHGFSSIEGPEDFNDNLSCQRAYIAADVLADAGVQINTLYKHGGTPGFAQDRRSVMIVVRSSTVEETVATVEEPVVTPQQEAISIAVRDCEEISRLYEARQLDAIGLFLQIYRCLTCSFVDAIRRGDFEEPLWLARVNHFAFERLKAALRTPNAEYRRAFAPCNLLDECSSPNQDPLTAIGCARTMQGTGALVLLQRCIEGVGEVHLRVDLRDALRTIGCATEVNQRDYRDVVPLFQACNREILSDEIPLLGGFVSESIAIPQITEQRDAAWSSAGCRR